MPQPRRPRTRAPLTNNDVSAGEVVSEPAPLPGVESLTDADARVVSEFVASLEQARRSRPLLVSQTPRDVWNALMARSATERTDDSSWRAQTLSVDLFGNANPRALSDGAWSGLLDHVRIISLLTNELNPSLVYDSGVRSGNHWDEIVGVETNFDWGVSFDRVFSVENASVEAEYVVPVGPPGMMLRDRLFLPRREILFPIIVGAGVSMTLRLSCLLAVHRATGTTEQGLYIGGGRIRLYVDPFTEIKEWLQSIGYSCRSLSPFVAPRILATDLSRFVNNNPSPRYENVPRMIETMREFFRQNRRTARRERQRQDASRDNAQGLSSHVADMIDEAFDAQQVGLREHQRDEENQTINAQQAPRLIGEGATPRVGWSHVEEENRLGFDFASSPIVEGAEVTRQPHPTDHRRSTYLIPFGERTLRIEGPVANGETVNIRLPPPGHRYISIAGTTHAERGRITRVSREQPVGGLNRHRHGGSLDYTLHPSPLHLPGFRGGLSVGTSVETRRVRREFVYLLTRETGETLTTPVDRQNPSRFTNVDGYDIVVRYLPGVRHGAVAAIVPTFPNEVEPEEIVRGL